MLARPREKPGLDAILRGEVQLAVASQAAAERRRVGHEIEAAEHFHQLSRRPDRATKQPRVTRRCLRTPTSRVSGVR
jgi:hypothetical protein